MKLPPLVADCGICDKVRSTEPPLFENQLWQVRPITPPCVVPGWMLLLSRRHVPGPAAFDDAEAASFGPTLRHLQRVLLEVTELEAPAAELARVTEAYRLALAGEPPPL